MLRIRNRHISDVHPSHPTHPPLALLKHVPAGCNVYVMSAAMSVAIATSVQSSSWMMARQETGCATCNAVHMHLVLTKNSHVDVSQQLLHCWLCQNCWMPGAKGLPHLSMLLMHVQFQQLVDWPPGACLLLLVVWLVLLNEQCSCC